MIEWRSLSGCGPRAAAEARRIREETGAALLVDCGDAFHGTLAAQRTEGSAVVPALNAEGVDLFVPGNWDYGFGPEVLRRRAGEMQFPVLAANLRDAGSGEAIFPGFEASSRARFVPMSRFSTTLWRPASAADPAIISPSSSAFPSSIRSMRHR